jgi:hypothetical protein
MLEGLAQQQADKCREIPTYLDGRTKLQFFSSICAAFRHALDKPGTNVRWIHVLKRGIHESK